MAATESGGNLERAALWIVIGLFLTLSIIWAAYPRIYDHYHPKPKWPGELDSSVSGQKTDSTPKETVEQLWNVAARGDLLTSSGWARASIVFTKPTASPGNGVILVVSNIYGVKWVSVEGKSAKVQVECRKLGRLDSRLHFTHEPPTKAYETDEEYHLISSPEYSATLPDGTPNLPETVVWRIEV